VTLSKQQATARATRVGASEVAQLTGSSGFGGPTAVYDRLTGAVGPLEKNRNMLVGIYLERHVLIMARRFMGLLSTPCWRAYVHKSLPLTASPDAYAKPYGSWPKGLVEVKVTSSRWNGIVPLYVVDQVQAQMWLTKRDLCHVAVLSGSYLDVITVERDEERIELIKRTLEAFDRDHLTPRIRPPEPDPLIVGATNK